MPDIDETRIGYLIGQIARLQANSADRTMDEIGLYRGQAILLLVLSENDGLAHFEIADKLKISPAAVTKVIKRLEALKLLQRRPDPSDERVSRVYIRKDGLAVVEKINHVFERIEQGVLRGFSPEERKTLFELLLRV